jgi:hypothetical protein
MLLDPLELELEPADLPLQELDLASLGEGRIEITNELTGEVWKFRRYHALYSLTRHADYFTFNMFSPGLYTIENTTEREVNVALFNRNYSIKPNMKWQLMAHRELEGHLDWQEVGRIKEC